MMLLLPLIVRQQQWGGTGTWAFNPPLDDFRPDALLDLRYLNEKTAGEHGFVKTSPDGSFLLGDGTPVRFWAVGTGVGSEKPFTPRPLGRQTEPDLDRHARFLAKRGVNMVRLHAQLSPDLSKMPNAKVTDVNADSVDWIWRAVAAMKKQGIYVTVSPYWMVPMKFGERYGIAGGTDQSAAGLLFFDPVLQEGYKAWLKALLTPTNPYTGVSLADDPDLAIFELQNEDSLLFWTFNSIKGPERNRLQTLYGIWAAKKYGSLAKAFSTWSDAKLQGDDAGAGLADFYNIWDATQPQTGAKQLRVGDQVEFLSETMKAFNAEMTDYIHKDLGCHMLVNAGNWRTADPTRLQDLERYSYTSTDVDAVNKYFDGVHKGPNNGWAIMDGDQFTNPSILQDPRPAPFNVKQTLNRPMVVTESSWVMPNEHDTEGPFLVSAYQSLNGLGAYFWFATGDDEWSQPKSANGYMPSQEKWIFGDPDVLGTFPGAALAYRMGYIRRAKPAVVEVRSLGDLWQRRTPVITEEPGFDPNRDAGDIAPDSGVNHGIDPLAFLVGPVEVQFGGKPSDSHAEHLSSFIDPSNSTVTSSTGEITLDYGRGYCTIDTPCAQGVAAFFTEHPTSKLTDVTFLSQNAYGSAMAVSMDGKPIGRSAKILIQYGTQCRPTGWSEKRAVIALDSKKTVQGFEVVTHGKAPWQVINADLTVVIKNPGVHSAVVLDMNGNAVRTLAVSRIAGGLQFKFPEDAMYVVVK